jgi:hypothetical protein
VEAHVGRLLASLGRPADAIAGATVRQFCKQARNLRVVR